MPQQRLHLFQALGQALQVAQRNGIRLIVDAACLCGFRGDQLIEMKVRSELHDSEF